eukprot:TRINITY_DN52346_c0_g1_i1.p1 TRINITY_DN52346_c0_g1~~TRINITY_DN52346_c0_g1_i1.p1  ORF type:complete len:129 (-),score=22.32 TRINITY_DN52346_c0_g1_i1:96-482(-)
MLGACERRRFSEAFYLPRSVVHNRGSQCRDVELRQLLKPSNWRLPRNPSSRGNQFRYVKTMQNPTQLMIKRLDEESSNSRRTNPMQTFWIFEGGGKSNQTRFAERKQIKHTRQDRLPTKLIDYRVKRL